MTDVGDKAEVMMEGVGRRMRKNHRSVILGVLWAFKYVPTGSSSL